MVFRWDLISASRLIHPPVPFFQTAMFSCCPCLWWQLFSWLERIEYFLDHVRGFYFLIACRNTIDSLLLSSCRLLCSIITYNVWVNHQYLLEISLPFVLLLILNFKRELWTQVRYFDQIQLKASESVLSCSKWKILKCKWDH